MGTRPLSKGRCVNRLREIARECVWQQRKMCWNDRTLYLSNGCSGCRMVILRSARRGNNEVRSKATYQAKSETPPGSSVNPKWNQARSGDAELPETLMLPRYDCCYLSHTVSNMDRLQDVCTPRESLPVSLELLGYLNLHLR